LPSKSTKLVTVNTYPFTVITRTNSSIIDVVVRMDNIGKKCHVIGGADEQIAQLEAIYCIHKGHETKYYVFKRFKQFKQLLIFANSREGESYKAIVNYISKKLDEIPDIVKALRACVSADKADVSCVTAHSAKGAEFDNVTIFSDFTSKDDKKFTIHEQYLLYVAITRAKKELNISKCEAIKSYLND
jgi:superfamily I DNA/RNA helicase